MVDIDLVIIVSYALFGFGVIAANNLEPRHKIMLERYILPSRRFYIKYPYRFYSASPKVKDNEDIALDVVTIDPYAFTYLSERLQNDRSFVLKAVTRNGRVLAHVPTPFKDDDEIVLSAMKSDTQSLWNASPRLFTNLPFNLKTLEVGGVSPLYQLPWNHL